MYSYENAAPDVVLWRDANLWRKYQETQTGYEKPDEDGSRHRCLQMRRPCTPDSSSFCSFCPCHWRHAVRKSTERKTQVFFFHSSSGNRLKKKKKSCFLLITVSNGRWIIDSVSTLLPGVQRDWTEKRYQTLTGEIFMVPCSGKKTEEHVEQIWSKTGGGSDGSDDTSFGCGKKFFAEEKHSGKYTCSTW